MKKQNKNDLILTAALLAVGFVLAAFFFAAAPRGRTVEVRVDGRVEAVYPLEKDGRYEIKGANGGNTLVIESGTARIDSASCPDKLCVKTGRLSRSGQSAICLPNRVEIRITGDPGDAGGVDTVTR